MNAKTQVMQNKISKGSMSTEAKPLAFRTRSFFKTIALTLMGAAMCTPLFAADPAGDIGKVFWLYHDRPSCYFGQVRLLTNTDRISVNFFQTDHAAKVEIVNQVAGRFNEPYYQVLVDGATTAYMNPFDLHKVGPAYGHCALYESPEEAAKIAAAEDEAKEQRLQQLEKLKAEHAGKVAALYQAAAEREKQRQELAKKPGARIGMSAQQVIEKTNWGKPDKVNTTVTQNMRREQWVYGIGSYLYFENGKLTAIQN